MANNKVASYIGYSGHTSFVFDLGYKLRVS